MKKIAILVSLLLVPLFLVTARLALASVRCEKQYGGGEICVKTGQLQINKEVWDPDGKKFVDNLGISSRRFAPGEEITFRLSTKNVGDATFDKVQVIDSLPQHLELVSGNTSFDINNLTVGNTQSAEIKARVVSADKLPSDKSIICEVNSAEVVSGAERDRDTAQVCLEKQVFGIGGGPKVLPKAGAENWLIALGSIFALAIGAYVMKTSKRWQERG